MLPGAGCAERREIDREATSASRRPVARELLLLELALERHTISRIAQSNSPPLTTCARCHDPAGEFSDLYSLAVLLTMPL